MRDFPAGAERDGVCCCLRRWFSVCVGVCDGVMAAFRGVWTQAFWRAISGEFVAMLLFVLLSLGSTIGWSDATPPTDAQDAPPTTAQPPDLVLISLCFGLAIATLVQCFGHISGAHINPAVTVAMVATRKLSLAKGVFYVTAQCLGAVAGAGLLYAITPHSVRGGMGVTTVNRRLSVGAALLVEMLITFQLLFTVCATCDPRRGDLRGSGALAIGLSVCAGHLFAIPFTGASMNPARSFGPALVMSIWENPQVYWVGPVMGGVLAAGLYEYLFCPNPRPKQSYALVASAGAFPCAFGEKQPPFTVLDVDRAERLDRREREPTGEVLSSV
uniref:Aquaporin-4 n=1 Tax=Denticeps clupeoides TaxID=299321 RepID=A0AAY4CU94_9TELE